MLQRQIAEKIYRDATLALQQTKVDEGGNELAQMDNNTGVIPFSMNNNANNDNNVDNEDNMDGVQDTGGFTKGNETESSETSDHEQMYVDSGNYANTARYEAEPSIDM